MLLKFCYKCSSNKPLNDFGILKLSIDGRRNICKSCRKSLPSESKISKKKYNSKYITNNKVKVLEGKKKYRELNQDKIRKYNKDHYEIRQNYDKSYQLKNKDKRKLYNKDYSKNNPGIINAKNSRRRASENKNIPNWLSLEQIQQIRNLYIYASMLTKFSNIRHEVDHIIPIKGKYMSGLHVPWNLRVITKEENCSRPKNILPFIINHA